MIQLWAWEYEGKTEFGYEISLGSEGFRRFMRVDSLASEFIRDERFITNLRKVKVVDEDVVVIEGITRSEMIWFVKGLGTTGNLNHASYPETFKYIQKLILNELTQDVDCNDHTFVNDECKYCGQNIPVIEPKNFGAIVEAEYADEPRTKWIRIRTATGTAWQSAEDTATWQYLITPTIISEGVE